MGSARYDPNAAQAGGGGFANFFAARGLSKAGISSARASFDVQEMLDLSQYTVTGAFTPSATALGGGVRNNGTANASLQRGTAAVGRVPICTAADRFYCAAVLKLGAGAFTAGAGQGITVLMTAAGGNGFYFGCENSTISAVKFGAYSFNGAVGAVASTKNIDAAWHYAELWFDGVGYRFAFDDEAPLTLAANLPAGGTQLNHGLQANPVLVACDMNVALIVTVTGSDIA